jgi:hypothetical protein
MATWDEIKKLAADFQRIQLVENSFKYFPTLISLTSIVCMKLF